MKLATTVLGLMVLGLGGCDPRVTNGVLDGICPSASTTAPVNGYCEDQSDCEAADFCWLERTLSKEGEVLPVNRCIPRQLKGDTCERDEDTCAPGLVCRLQDVCTDGSCSRGTCR